MRIGPFDLSLRAAKQETLASPPKELGASGTINLSGFLQTSEYLDNLRGLAGLQAIDQMLRSDGSVQEAVEHIYAPIKNANWSIEPASDGPDALEQAAFVQCAYFKHLVRPWQESLDEQLDYLLYGHAVFETVYQIQDEALYYEDPQGGGQVELPSRQFLTLKAFAPRLQQTLYKWMTKDGELTSVVQRTYVPEKGTYQEIEIPAEQLLVLTNRIRGAEWTGRSMLRSAYKHWFAKDLIEKIEMVSLERWGVGIAVGGLPLSEKGDAAAMNRLEDMLVNIKGGEQSYMAFPGPVNQTGNQESFTFSIESPKGSVPNFSEAIERHRADIKAAVLARFAELGHQRTGARAVGDIQSVVWFAALHAISKYIEQAHEPVIKRLVDANYPGVSEYPKLVGAGIEARNLQEYSAAVSALVSSAALTMDKSTEAWVRNEIDAPDQDEIEEQEPDPTDPNEPAEQELQPGDPGYQAPQNGQSAGPVPKPAAYK